ncbi:extracellular solute-binding protein [Ornithinimicrobium faecis]|uniref:Extracellular solute-binding protein n=1 Tax=Ornithinimicrobium faecis TaxID=2934158 RepID=A0ABY4YWY2_9MICO|nr:extracellular solute-binding protein [Ornithinimicrobium sp. HY1793]USQ80955.1 extracellular solute-binding protein [Ornithinimicrobium sp. HY1793]
MSRARQRSRATAALCAAAMLTGLAACGSDSDKPQLNWYINPDGQDTLAAIAERCSTDAYDINIQLLPASATDQRTQLARRLAAQDGSTDLMSLDPVFVAEFANAGWLEEFPDDVASQVVDDDVLQGAADTVTWEDGVFAAPQWANTQVVWYRKSLAEAAGLDMEQPVTWDAIIDAAADNNGTVGVQANRYEAYTVWINAMVLGAGGDIVSNTEAGRDAQVDIDSDAGRAAAEVIAKLASSEARQPDFTVSNEGTSLGRMFPEDPEAAGGAGEFMLNWTFVYKNYEDSVSEEEFADLGWARYPQTIEGEDSRPPIGGIDIGVGAYSQNTDLAMEAAVCMTDVEAQTALAVNDGLMPARESAYDSDELQEAYDPSLLELFRVSIEEGGPRPKSAFYSQISSAVQSVWHSPAAVDPAVTPQESSEFLRDVLDGRRLL